jgi:NIPSNAP
MWKLTLALFAALAAVTARAADDQPTTPAAGHERLFEMRTYTANEGKLEALNARFRNHTNKLFVKHGMELIGYWIPTDPKKSQNTLIYILAYPSKEARDASWKAFQADPEWKRAAAESEKDGKLVSKVVSEFMTPTDYSPMK